MKPARKWLRRLSIGAVILFAAAAAGAPFLKADRFAGNIREALERTLHRKVVVGSVHFHLITGPGFTVDDVVIYDDPSVGLEPFAYVTELDVRLNWRSLLTRRLELDRLRLKEPSVNLNKAPGGYWNFQQLLGETLGASRGGALPGIEVRDGRINFKFGTLKSAFYLTNADLDLWPAEDFEDRFRLRFTGEPARTDRSAQGFGRLAASGWWRSPRNAESELEMDLEIERSGIADVMTLIAGRDIGLHGSMTSRAHLSGRISSLGIKGQMSLQDVHRWDLLPTRAAQWPVSYQGRLDLWDQKLELETVQQGEPRLPFVIRVRASDYLSQPHWAVSASVEDFPAEYVLEIARQLGIVLPDGFKMQGAMNGVIGYGSQSGVQGQLELKGAVLESPGSGPLHTTDAHLTVNGNAYHLQPAEVRTADDEAATVEGDYDRATEALRFTVSTRGLSQAAMPAATGALFGATAPSFLAECQGGTWRGTLHYARAGREPGQWNGALTLEKTQIAVPGLADPVRIAAASVALQSEVIAVTKLTGSAGEIAFTGDYRMGGKLDRIQLAVAEADAAELERLLAPTLQRRQNFLARALRRPVPLPEWLRTRRIEGVVRISHLKLVDTAVDDLRGNLLWEGPAVEVSALEGRALDARGKGTLKLNLRGVEPRYTLEGRLWQFPWHGGQLDLDGKFETAGFGEDLWLNLTAGGKIIARAVQLGSDDVKSVLGAYELSVVRGAPRLQLTGLELTLGQDTYYGQGGTQPDGKLQIELASGKQKMRVGGSLTPLQFEIARQ